MTKADKLIQQFKKEYSELTGKGVKISICSKSRSEASFTDKGDFWKLAKLVLDYGDWKWSDVFYEGKYEPIQYRAGTEYTLTSRVGLRNEERIFRRRLIDFICMNNGVSSNSVAKNTGRDHTTILHSANMFEESLETDYYTQKTFRELLGYIKKHYKDLKNISKEDVIGTNI